VRRKFPRAGLVNSALAAKEIASYGWEGLECEIKMHDRRDMGGVVSRLGVGGMVRRRGVIACEWGTEGVHFTPRSMRGPGKETKSNRKGRLE